jgi:hypothetical protein
MTAVARAWLSAAALVAAGLLVWSAYYLADTITGPRPVNVDYTPSTTPRSVP